jgi:hypothetical protein
LLLILLFLFISLLPFSLLMSTAPHIFTTQETHTKTKKKERKNKTKRRTKRLQKSQIKTQNQKKKAKTSQRPQKKPLNPVLGLGWVSSHKENPVHWWVLGHSSWLNWGFTSKLNYHFTKLSFKNSNPCS